MYAKGLTILFIASMLLKLVAIGFSIRWFSKHGRNYATHMKELEKNHRAGITQITERDYIDGFQRFEGNYFPFGAKDYKWRQYIQRLGRGTCLGRLWGCTLKLVHFCLFDYSSLVLITPFYILIFLEVVSRGLLLTWIFVMIIMNLLMGTEAAFGWATMGGRYATYFHMRTPARRAWAGGSKLLPEIQRLIRMVFAIAWVGAAACLLIYAKWGNSFKGDALLTYHQPSQEVCGGWLFNSFGIFLQFIYFTSTTVATVGYGDIVPNNGWAQLIAFLIQVQSFGLLIIVFSILLNVAKEGEAGDHGGVGATTPPALQSPAIQDPSGGDKDNRSSS